MLNDREIKLLVGLALLLVMGASVRVVASRWPSRTPGVVLTPGAEADRPASARGAAALDSLFVDGRLDLNAAGVEELVLLPGIGPALATRVVDFRRREGPFRDVSELTRVRGIGPKTMERLRPLVLLRPAGAGASADTFSQGR